MDRRDRKENDDRIKSRQTSSRTISYHNSAPIHKDIRYSHVFVVWFGLEKYYAQWQRLTIQIRYGDRYTSCGRTNGRADDGRKDGRTDGRMHVRREGDG